MRKREIFLNDILEKIIENNNAIDDLRTFLQFIQHQRNLEPELTAKIYDEIGGTSHTINVISQDIIKNMPYPVAYLLENVNLQVNDLIRVLFLSDAIECFVRWRMSEMLTAIFYERGNIADELTEPIRKSILKPSMGSWVTGYGHLAKQVNDKETWGINKIEEQIATLQEITSFRNKLAHGDIAGDATQYLNDIKTRVLPILEDYSKLSLHYYIAQTKENETQKNEEKKAEEKKAENNEITSRTVEVSLSATGPSINTISNKTYDMMSISEDNRKSYFVVQFGEDKNKQTCQIPCLFLVFLKTEIDAGDFPQFIRDDGSIEQVVEPCVIGSYISSQGKCASIDDGSHLEYTLINTTGLYEEEETENFVLLFKTNKPIRASQLWLALLDEITDGSSIAWDYDRQLIKDWRDENSVVTILDEKKKEECSSLEHYFDTKIPISEESTKILFFGGEHQKGKSTLLLSYLKNQNSIDKGNFVFVYRFAKNCLQKEYPLDDFFFSLRNALVFWLGKFTDIDEPNHDLSGDDLYEDTFVHAELFLSLQGNHSNYLYIGIDDVHHLYQPGKTSTLDVLCKELCRYGVFSTIRSKYKRQEGAERIFAIEQFRQVFSVMTGFSSPLDDDDGNKDIDHYFHDHKNVDFLYKWFGQRDYQLLQRWKGPEERKDEIRMAIEEYTNPKLAYQKGAHLPEIGGYGVKKILFNGNSLPQLAQILQPSQTKKKKQQANPSSANQDLVNRGKKYIDELLEKSNRNPSIINSIAVQLQSGQLTIDEPIDNGLRDIIIPNVSNPFFHDISALVPLIICFMETLQQPLTVSTLQILCGAGLLDSSIFQPNINNNKFILQALYTIPRFVKKTVLEEVDEDGNIAHGWEYIGSETEHMELDHTLNFVAERIHFCVQHYTKIPHNIQLRNVIETYIESSKKKEEGAESQTAEPKQTVEQENTPKATQIPPFSVETVFQNLRGAIPSTIRAIVQQYPQNQVLKSSAAMLYQSNAVSSSQITWLQKAWESKEFQAEAETFYNKEAFSQFWLKHINCEHRKVFVHQKHQLSFQEKIEEVQYINNKFFLVIGTTKDGYKPTIAIYNTNRSRPDLIYPKTEGIFSFIYNEERQELHLAIAYEQDVVIYKIYVQQRAKELSNQRHQYTKNETTTENKKEDSTIVGIEHQKHSFLIIGKRKKDDEYEIDKVYIDNKTPDVIRVSSVTVDPKLIFRHPLNDALFITYGTKLYQFDSTVFDISFVPVKVICTKNSIVFIGGSKKSSRKMSWLPLESKKTSKMKTSDMICENSKKKKDFHEIIFAEDFTIETETGEYSYLFTIDYKGFVRIYDWKDKKLKFEETLPQLKQETIKHKTALRGCLLFTDTLIVYGARACVQFYNIDIKKSIEQNALKVQHLSTTDYHFGGSVMNAQPIEGEHLGYEEGELFATISQDNDMRLWSVKKQDCIGLFRAHQSPLKLLVQNKNRLMTADSDKNICIWEINDGCINQKLELPIHTPNFVQKAIIYKDILYVVSSNLSGVFLESYKENGTGWTQKQACLSQKIDPDFSAFEIKKVYFLECQNSSNPNGFFVVHYNKDKVRYYDIEANKAQKTKDWTDLTDKEGNIITIKGIKYHGDKIFLYNDKNIYLIEIDEKTSSLTCGTIKISISDNEKITAIHLDSSNKKPAVMYVTSQLEEDIGLRRVYKDEQKYCEFLIKKPAQDNAKYACWIERSHYVDIEHLYDVNGSVLFTCSEDPLEAYLYLSDDLYDAAKEGKRILKIPQHPSLRKNPRELYISQSEHSIQFRSGDTSLQWFLRYDYPINEGEAELSKELILTSQPAFAHVQETFDATIEQKKQSHFDICSLENDVFVDTEPYGVVLHYKNPLAKHGKSLVWTGNMVQGYKLGNVVDKVENDAKGLIVLYKNRDVIVLQLMKGNREVSFAELAKKQAL